MDTPTSTLAKYKMFIGGEWVDAASGETFESDNPFTGKPWALVPKGNGQDADRAVRAAHKAFTSGEWPKLTPSRRGALLRKLADLIGEQSKFLAEMEVRDNGKLYAEMSAQTAYMAQWYYYYGGLADKVEGHVIPSDKPDMFNFTRYEPLGVVAAIIPWNSPLLLVAWKLAPALAAGNTVVLKPSEYTSASTLEFMKLIPLLTDPAAHGGDASATGELQRRLGHDLPSYGAHAPESTDPPPELNHLHVEQKLVARLDGAPEFHAVHRHEVDDLVRCLADFVHQKQAPGLRHSFDDQHTGHDRVAGEMT